MGEGENKKDGEKPKDPVIEKNLAIAKAAEEEAKKKREETPVGERVKKMAQAANSTGGSLGAGLAGLGAQVAKAVAKSGDGKINVSKIVEEEEKLSKQQAKKEI